MSRRHLVTALTAAAWLAVGASLLGVGPSFRPDATLAGTSLAGWHPVGDAGWRMQNGELVGTPKAPGGGWLMLDRSLQDVGFYASFLCAQGCRTGVLLRAEKTADGMKGVYVALTDGDIGSYSVTLDSAGRIVKRDPLRPGGGTIRIAPPPDPNPPARAGGGGRQGRGASPVKLPVTPPDSSMKAGDWNRIQILLDANIVRPRLNDGNQATGGVADPEVGNYGPIALYVGGTGDVRFKEVAYKDLAVLTRPAEELSKNFKMQRLTDFYYSWGAGAADVDHDGVLDVVSGPHIFLGPDYLRRREIYLQIATNPSTAYTTDDWMQFVADFTEDGWADALNCNFSGGLGCTLYVNPKNESRRWSQYFVVPGFQTEIAVMRDVDGDGKPEIVYGGQGQMRYAEPDPANPTGTWIMHNVSEAGLATAHGVGVGDINGDGRMDILNPFGWWEQPPAGSKQEPWPYHAQAFARYSYGNMGGVVMAVYDVNGDGKNDVVTVLSAHTWGLAWYEQQRDAQGNITFVQHMIMDDFWTKNAGNVTFSQPHASAVADVDGDGIPDFIVAKRYWSHTDNYNDPDPYGPAVLYSYRTVRNPKAPGGAEFVPELIHNQSGGGSDVYPVDLNKDGRMDIVTATRFGTFVFLGQPRK